MAESTNPKQRKHRMPLRLTRLGKLDKMDHRFDLYMADVPISQINEHAERFVRTFKF